MKLWVLIYTHDKTEEACVQIEIIRTLRKNHFSDIKIVHAYNWAKKKYPKKYLEDKVIYLDNPWHYCWAANLMDAGVKALLKYKDLDYLMINACDSRRLSPEKITKILWRMKKEKKVIGTCPWWFPGQTERRWVGMACDSFFLDAKREKENHIFPLKHKEFYDKYIDFIRYMWHNNVLVEALLASRYITACSNITKDRDAQLWFYANDKVYLIKERMPTMLSTTQRNFDIPSLGLYTDHDTATKKKLIKKYKLVWPYAKKYAML